MYIQPEGKTTKQLYKLLSGSVTPRPIALVSTKNDQGIANVAPYSYFTVVSSKPPIVMFSIGERASKKDTLSNIENHPEFVINLVDMKLAQAVHNAAALFRPEVSEFDEVNLTPIPTKVINSVAVKESLIRFECKLERIIKVGDCFMVLGEVVNFYIDDGIYLGDYKTDFKTFNPLSRFAGNDYGEIGRYIPLEREFDQSKIIKDAEKYLD